MGGAFYSPDSSLNVMATKQERENDYDNYGYSPRRAKPRRCSLLQFDKNATIRTFMHYTDHKAGGDPITVFGEATKGLFYNYSDRLYGSRWDAGWEKAKAEAQPNTARFFEIALNHFHNTTDVKISHIMLGCNGSNGQSYLVFGYTYTGK